MKPFAGFAIPAKAAKEREKRLQQEHEQKVHQARSLRLEYLRKLLDLGLIEQTTMSITPTGILPQITMVELTPEQVEIQRKLMAEQTVPEPLPEKLELNDDALSAPPIAA